MFGNHKKNNVFACVESKA